MIGNDHGDRVRRRRRRCRRAWSRAEGRRASRRPAASPRSRTHARPASAARVERARDRRRARRRARRPTRSTSGALDTITTGRAPAAATTRSAIVRVNARRASSSSASARRALPSANDRNGTTTPAVWERRRADMACVCYRPWTPCTPWRRACSRPGCGGACTGRSKARSNIPTSGPGGAREQPRVVSRPADARVGRRPPRPPRAVPRQGRAVRQAGARPAAPRRAPDPGAAGAGPTPPTRSPRRSTRSARGECVGVFPEGTISQDLEPMVGKSGTARLAQRAGVAITPVGLVGHAPDPHQGPQAALAVGRRADRGGRRADRARARRAREGDDRSDDGRDRRVRRPGPRDLPGTPTRARTPWWWRDPEHRGRAPENARDARRGDRRGVVGHGGRRDRRRQRADGAVGAPRRARGEHRHRAREPRLPRRASRCPHALHATADLAAACARRRRRRVRGAVARPTRGARRGAAAHRAAARRS